MLSSDENVRHDGLAVQARPGAIGGKQEVVLIVTAGIDIDSKSKNPKYATQAQNLLILQQFAHLPPSAIIGSDGPHGGLHAYWFLQPLIIRSMAEYEYVHMIFRRWYLYLADIIPGDLDATSGPSCRYCTLTKSRISRRLNNESRRQSNQTGII